MDGADFLTTDCTDDTDKRGDCQTRLASSVPSVKSVAKKIRPILVRVLCAEVTDGSFLRQSEGRRKGDGVHIWGAGWRRSRSPQAKRFRRFTPSPNLGGSNETHPGRFVGPMRRDRAAFCPPGIQSPWKIMTRHREHHAPFPVHVAAKRKHDATTLAHAAARRRHDAATLVRAAAKREHDAATLAHAAAKREDNSATLAHVATKREHDAATLGHVATKRKLVLPSRSHFAPGVVRI